MELYFVAAAILLCSVVLLVLLLLYLALYRRHINRVLENAEQTGRKWISPASLLGWLPVVLLLCVVTVCILELTLDISQSRLTSREEILNSYSGFYRENPKNWEQTQMVMTMTDEFALVLHYPQDHSDSRFDIYRDLPGEPLDYELKRRMSLTPVELGVLMVECDGAMLFGSLNEIRVAKIVTDSGAVYEIDPDEPFVLVIPEGCTRLAEKTEDPAVILVYGYSGFTAYDEYGKEMDLLSYDWSQLETMP